MSYLETTLTADANFKLTEVTMESPTPLGSSKETKSYSELKHQLPETAKVFDTTFLLTIISMVVSIISMIFVLILVIKQKLKFLAVIFPAIALILCLLTVTYFPIGLTSAMQKEGGEDGINSFIGSKEMGGGIVKLVWGPSVGWYLMIIAGILFLIVILVIIATKLPAPEQPYQQPMYPQCPQQQYQQYIPSPYHLPTQQYSQQR